MLLRIFLSKGGIVFSQVLFNIMCHRWVLQRDAIVGAIKSSSDQSPDENMKDKEGRRSPALTSKGPRT